jgi:NhaA family Na+:H+ antiporter
MGRDEPAGKWPGLPALSPACYREGMARRPTLEFLKTESGAGLVLVLAAFAALVMANSRWAPQYHALVEWPVPVRVGDFKETLSVLDWVRDGLMAVFFLVVGMEIKFEVLRGELSSPRRLVLPLVAAIGGAVAPALMYLAFNLGRDAAPRGWPIPTATDIAFALAALAVAAPRMPASLRVFLLALAIADDLGAVGLIAILFTDRLDPAALAGAAAGLAVLASISRWRRAPFILYAAGFLAVWAFTLKSGVNPSIAGIACAMTTPVGPRRPGQESVLKYFMDSLHPYVAYLILPLFAFLAAGFSFSTMRPAHLTASMPLGIAIALLIGKPLGVFGASAAAVALRWGRRPTGSTWIELLGVSMLCGVGFTMSLYLGALNFRGSDPVTQAQVRLGVLAGSAASALVGGSLIAWAQRRRAGLEEDRLP